MKLADTHCHLQMRAFDADRAAVIARALAELAWLIVIGDTLPSSREAAALCAPRVYAAVGIHPHHADEATPETVGELRRLAEDAHAAAIGEIGLDYYYEHVPRARQRQAFLDQLELAHGLGLPVVVHCRDAHDDMVPILSDWRGRLRGVMHCFSGGPALARQYTEFGLHISFAGNCTFPKAELLREAAQAVPIDRLLIETDAPYLAPQPVRGKRCEPVHVLHTATLLAALRDIPLETLAETTTQNAEGLFAIE